MKICEEQQAAAILQDTDQNARIEALNCENSYIVQAPAGSGKTELLTQRYLALLAHACHFPEEILAITFTRKAAAQMRQRVVSALDCAENKTTVELAQKVLEKDHLLKWNLKQNPSRLRIMTIDALCVYLTSQMPLLSGSGSQVEIIEKPKTFYRKSAQEVILHSFPFHLLKHLDNNTSRLINLCSDLLQKREQWLPYILSHNTPQQLRHYLELGLRRLAQEAIEKANHLLASHKNTLFSLLNFAGKNLQKTQPKHSVVMWANLAHFPEAHYNQLDTWQSLTQAFLTGKQEWRKTVTISNGFPPKTPEKQAFEKLLSFLSEEPVILQAFQEIQNCPPVQYSEEQWSIVLVLIELLPTLAAQLQLLFQENGAMDFIELGFKASQSLGGEQPTDLALTLDYRIRHVLVDEFQDTSVAQFKLLEKLLLGWQEGDGRSLFLVGDPMQSIYRFRNAEVGLFLRTQQQGLNNIQLQPLQLSLNFRCGKSLIDWYNQIFPNIFPKEGNRTEGAIPYTPAMATRLQLHQPAVNCYGCGDSSDEAQQLIQIIQKYQQLDPSSHIAVLVRARSHLKSIIIALQAEGIRFQAVELDLLSERSEIQDLAALTRALHHRADRIAWLSVLRAPFCGLTLKDLQVISMHDPQRTLLESLINYENIPDLSEDAQVRLKRVVPVILYALQNAGRLPLSLWVENAWIALGGPASLTDSSQLQNAQAYFNLLESCFKFNESFNAKILEEQLQELYALADSDTDCHLQIMTIHKAKGLEFDHVIIPELQRKGNVESQRLLMWMERVNAEGGTDLMLAPIKKSVIKEDSLYSYLSLMEKKKLSLEMSRLFYVAVTRAKQTVHLLAVLPHEDLNSWEPLPDTFLKLIWGYYRHQLVEHWPPKETVISNTASPSTRFSFLRRITSDWQPSYTINYKVSLETNTLDFNNRDLEASILGTVVHQALARPLLPDVESIRSEKFIWKKQLRQLSFPEDKIEDAISMVEQALMNTMQDPRGQWVFSSAHSQCRYEYALSAKVKGEIAQVILDRTFIDNSNVRWIIEFKSSEPSEENLALYRQQLSKYAAIISQLDSRPIKLGIYFPLKSFWVEFNY